MRDLGRLYFQALQTPTDPLAWAQLADHLEELGQDAARARFLAFAFDNWPAGIPKEELTVRAVGPADCTGVAEGLTVSLLKDDDRLWRWIRPGPNTAGPPLRFNDRDGVHWRADSVTQWRWRPEWM